MSLHNLEEASRLPGDWARRDWHFLSASEFRSVALLVAGLGNYLLSLRREKSVVARRLFLVFCWVMLVNAFWHIAATLYIRSYAPGVATAALLVLPTTSYHFFGVRLED